MSALRNNNPAAALATTRLHARETAHRGQLAEDAAAIELEALCALHAPSSQISSRLAAFDRRWPSSAQRARITSSCDQP